MKMKKKVRISLKVKSVSVVILMALIMAIIAIAMSYNIYANTMDAHYKRLATNLSKTAITQIDHDMLKECIETGQKSEEYEKTRLMLKEILNANDVECIYALQLRPDVGKTFAIIDTDDSVALGDIDKLVQRMPYGVDELVYISNTDAYGWLCSSMTNMYDSDGNNYAVMCVDISMNDVMSDRHDFLRDILFIICLIMVAIVVVIVFLVGKFIINPINQLADATDSFVAEHTGVACTDEDGSIGKRDPTIKSAISKLNIRTGDEIQSLAEAIKSMEREINEYIVNLTSITAEKERIGTELSVATNIQASMLPCTFPAFPERVDLDIYASMIPAKEVGGDFYDFFLVDDNHLALVMADVSGKGVPAALFMVIAKTLIKNSTQSGLSPKEVLEKVNAQLCENNEADMFVTTWLGILDIKSGKVVCANAGHEYPVIKRCGGEYEIIKDKHGFVLAGMDCARYTEYDIDLAKGDTLFLYTDGVPEATNSDNILMGNDRMLAALNTHCDANCQELLHLIKDDIDKFVGDAPQFDDITMLAIELK